MNSTALPGAIERDWSSRIYRVYDKMTRARRVCEVATKVADRAQRKLSPDGFRRAEQLVRRAENLRVQAVEELRKAWNELPSSAQAKLVERMSQEERDLLGTGA